MRDTSILHVYCQEPSHLPRQSGLHVAVIADGNGRRGRAGHAAGARNVVRCAEHCLERGDVALFCALLLSPENVRKRGERFFATLHALFVRLVADVRTGRALAGVRCEIYGGLGGLKKRGGAARRLAHAIELLLEIASPAEARMRLVFGIDYDDEVIPALHLDLVLRTGMEASNLIRLSGLRPHPSTVCVATMKLWCELEPSDLEEALSAAERCLPAPFAHGYDASFVASFLDDLLREGITAPLRITLPVAAPEAALVEALRELERGPLGAQDRLAVDYVSSRSPRPLRFGPKGEARQTVVLLSPSRRERTEHDPPIDALLAPGQPSSVWKLVDLPLGYASGHGCAPTPLGLVEGLCRALRFQADHPALRGGERGSPSSPVEAAAAWPSHIEDLLRVVAEQPLTPAEEIAREQGGGAGPDRQILADVFAARELGGALERGLLSREAHWKRAALNYCYTGFAIPFHVPEPTNPTGAGWEPLARHLTRFMLAVAAADEEITDRVFPGETERGRRERLVASVRFLSGALRGEVPGAPPAVEGAGVLGAIAAQLEEMRARFVSRSHPRLFEGFCRAALGLFQANLDELSPAIADNALLRRFGQARSRSRAREAIERRYAATAPACVADRIRALLAAPADEETVRRLRLLCYLSDVAPSIGAGATFRAAALWAPAASVTESMVTSLDRVASLVDYRFRLANDLSDLAGSADGDRDAKENAWTVLVPKRAFGRAREAALVSAAIACDELAVFLDGALRSALADLEACWPSLTTMVKRGIHVGGRFYSMGHYAELSRQDVAAILDELPDAGTEPPTPASGRRSSRRSSRRSTPVIRAA